MRDGRDKAVFGGALEVNKPFVFTGLVGGSGVSGHHVGVDVNGVDRIGDRDFVSGAKDIEDVPRIALGPVGHKNVVWIDAQTGVGVFHDGFAKEGIALLGAVTAESAAITELIDCFFHRLPGCLGNRLGDIADSAADETFGFFRLGLGVGIHPAGDFGEKVSCGKLLEVFVDASHDAIDLPRGPAMGKSVLISMRLIGTGHQLSEGFGIIDHPIRPALPQGLFTVESPGHCDHGNACLFRGLHIAHLVADIEHGLRLHRVGSRN